VSEEPEFSFRSKLAVVAVVAVVVVASVVVVAAVRCPLRSSGGEGQRMAAGLQPTGMWILRSKVRSQPNSKQRKDVCTKNARVKR